METGVKSGLIQDSRAFLGAMAMVIIGIILSLMVAFYMLPEVFGKKALMARWWWEIVLNLQILCYAFMWFCHHNRIVHSSGWWRLRAVSHFIVGMISVSYPAGILLISAMMDWFRVPPSPTQVYITMIAAVALWAFGAFIMPIVNWVMVRGQADDHTNIAATARVKRALKTFWPTLALFALGICEWSRGGLAGFALMPLLMYIQGALPYFAKARHASPRDMEF
ncbi:MAG: hypothetical protein HWE25_03560 [Alphaproteobacteria bacterium]|nr:hypothetical protein [Alphaproteobacteria bacterium]